MKPSGQAVRPNVTETTNHQPRTAATRNVAKQVSCAEAPQHGQTTESQGQRARLQTPHASQAWRGYTVIQNGDSEQRKGAGPKRKRPSNLPPTPPTSALVPKPDLNQGYVPCTGIEATPRHLAHGPFKTPAPLSRPSLDQPEDKRISETPLRTTQHPTSSQTLRPDAYDVPSDSGSSSLPSPNTRQQEECTTLHHATGRLPTKRQRRVVQAVVIDNCQPPKSDVVTNNTGLTRPPTSDQTNFRTQVGSPQRQRPFRQPNHVRGELPPAPEGYSAIPFSVASTPMTDLPPYESLKGSYSSALVDGDEAQRRSLRHVDNRIDYRELTTSTVANPVNAPGDVGKSEVARGKLALVNDARGMDPDRYTTRRPEDNSLQVDETDGRQSEPSDANISHSIENENGEGLVEDNESNAEDDDSAAALPETVFILSPTPEPHPSTRLSASSKKPTPLQCPCHSHSHHAAFLRTLPQDNSTNPDPGNYLPNGLPRMTSARRLRYWPSPERLPDPALRGVYHVTKGTHGGGRRRHDIAPYAFQLDGRPYSEYEIVVFSKDGWDMEGEGDDGDPDYVEGQEPDEDDDDEHEEPTPPPPRDRFTRGYEEGYQDGLHDATAGRCQHTREERDYDSGVEDQVIVLDESDVDDDHENSPPRQHARPSGRLKKERKRKRHSSSAHHRRHSAKRSRHARDDQVNELDETAVDDDDDDDNSPPHQPARTSRKPNKVHKRKRRSSSARHHHQVNEMDENDMDDDHENSTPHRQARTSSKLKRVHKRKRHSSSTHHRRHSAKRSRHARTERSQRHDASTDRGRPSRTESTPTSSDDSE